MISRSSTPSVRREHALFAWMAERDALSQPDRFRRVADAVLAVYEGDRRQFSNVLEPSVASGPVSRSHARFSYAFPRHATESARVGRDLLQIAETLGPGVPEAAERVLRAARHRVVEQPLIGLAVDDASSWRPKLYLQLRSGAPDVARRLAGAVLTIDAETIPHGDLHLVGMDLDEHGHLTGAKLYYRGSAADPPDRLRGVPAAALADVLHIHRLRSADDEIGAPTEIDFAVGGASIAWQRLHALVPALGALDLLCTEFAIQVRRASLAPNGRATAYYVLAAVE